jgi:hypothetical protein
MSKARKATGWTLLAAAFALTAIAYYLSWRSGCLFDWKQGTGDYQSADKASLRAFVAACAGLLSLVLAVPLIWQPTVPAVLGSLLFFGIIAGPLSMLMLASASTSGTRSCEP